MKRVSLVGFVVALVFAGVAALLIQLMPPPLKVSDYVVIGSVATLGSLVVLFFMMVASKQGLFFKRRKKQ
jgi:hypothetical protein